MKISFNWLKQFIDISISPNEVAEMLTDIGLEVEKTEEIESIKGGLKGLVIGEVIMVEKHPDADRLKVTSVNIGEASLQQIVCGAPNVEKGQKVVVALPGTTVFPSEGESFKIKKSKIRGVASNGMICAEDEIGLGKGHDGIMVLDVDAKEGDLASVYFNVENDVVFEIGLTPNRADAMSHLGVARDLLVAFKHKKLLPESTELCLPRTTSFKTEKNDLPIAVEVKNHQACPRYAGVTIKKITVGPSPEWLQKRLATIGIQSINNVVDCTNYILHDLGQPLHAFDADTVGNKVIVGPMQSGTPFTTLDEIERQLSEEDLMICNEKSPMCIAGVFGGLDSGVTTSTTSIFLESAYFNPVSIRKTAKRFGLSTDASFRFERGIDPNNVVYALQRAATLIVEVAGGYIASEIVDLYPNPIDDFQVEVSLSRIERLCGIQFNKNEVITILKNLEIEVLKEDKNGLLLKVPAYRVDVQREADIAEEILRIIGYNRVPLPEKLNTSITSTTKPDKEKVQRIVSDFLLANGLYEGMSNSLTRSVYHQEFESSSIKESFNVDLLNPLSSDLNVMRQSLIFGGLEAVRLNQNHGNENVKLFEFGKVYHRYDNKFQEEAFLGLFLSGQRQKENWNVVNTTVSFFVLKGLVEGLLKKLGVFRNPSIQSTKKSLFEDGLSYTIAKKKIAEIGWVNDAMKQHFDLKNNVFYAEINWTAVLSLLAMNKVKFKPISKYPSVTRDLSLLIDRHIKFEEIADCARKTNKKILKDVTLFDVYTGKNLESNKKSYAVRFILQDENKTLEEVDIEQVMSTIQNTLEEKVGAQLR